MEWGRVKNILIYVLIAVNIFLMSVLAMDYQQENYHAADIAKVTSELLSTRNILIEQREIPLRKNSDAVYSLHRREDFYDLAAAFFADYSYAEATSEGSRRYESDAGRVTIGADGAVSCEFVNLPAPESWSGYARALERWLGLENNTFAAVKLSGGGTDYQMRLFEQQSGVWIKDCELIFTVSGGGITAIEGKIVDLEQKNVSSSGGVDAVSALFTLADSGLVTESQHVRSIIYMYCLYEQETGVLLSPCYKIVFESGAEYYILSNGEIK